MSGADWFWAEANVTARILGNVLSTPGLGGWALHRTTAKLSCSTSQSNTPSGCEGDVFSRHLQPYLSAHIFREEELAKIVRVHQGIWMCSIGTEAEDR